MNIIQRQVFTHMFLSKGLQKTFLQTSLMGSLHARTFAAVKEYNPKVDYYKILGVTKDATESEIKKMYYKLALQYHPDKTGGKTTEKFKDISNAYSILGDTVKKRGYDSARNRSSSQSPYDWSSKYHTTSSAHRKSAQQQSTWQQGQDDRRREWQSEQQAGRGPRQQEQEQKQRQYRQEAWRKQQEERQAKQRQNQQQYNSRSNPFAEFFNQQSAAREHQAYNERMRQERMRREDEQRIREEEKHRKHDEAGYQGSRTEWEKEFERRESEWRRHDQHQDQRFNDFPSYENEYAVRTAKDMWRSFFITFSFVSLVFWYLSRAARKSRQHDMEQAELNRAQRDFEYHQRLQTQPEMYRQISHIHHDQKYQQISQDPRKHRYITNKDPQQLLDNEQILFNEMQRRGQIRGRPPPPQGQSYGH